MELNMQAYANQIRSHGEYDSVLILAVKHDDLEKVTRISKAMDGNLFSNIGAAENFVLAQREYGKEAAMMEGVCIDWDCDEEDDDE